MLGDESRLRQVVTNLVTNALTHTPAGTPVSVSLEVTPGQDGDPDRVLLAVADQGPGMTEADRAKVFERFYRADPSRTRSAGGSGLGLSIVAALVAAHGGRVGVQSAPGEGTPVPGRAAAAHRGGGLTGWSQVAGGSSAGRARAPARLKSRGENREPHRADRRTDPWRTAPADAIDPPAAPVGPAPGTARRGGGRARTAAAGATGVALSRGGGHGGHGVLRGVHRHADPERRPGREVRHKDGRHGPGHLLGGPRRRRARRVRRPRRLGRLPHDADPAGDRDQGQRLVDHGAQRGRVHGDVRDHRRDPGRVPPGTASAASRTAPTSR